MLRAVLIYALMLVVSVAGWVLVTDGLASLFPAEAAAIWKLSTGLLLLGLVGYRVVWEALGAGLWVLTGATEDSE